MSTREEALVAVYVAARALQRHGPTNELLAALFAAVEAVDAAGEHDCPDPRRGPCEVCWSIAWAPTPDGERCAHCALYAAYLALGGREARVVPLAGSAECAPGAPVRAAAALAGDLPTTDSDRPGFCTADASCWRAPITPGGVCFEHSAENQRPRPWERAQLRAGVGGVPEGQDG